MHRMREKVIQDESSKVVLFILNFAGLCSLLEDPQRVNKHFKEHGNDRQK